MVRSLVGDNFFNIVTGASQGDTLAAYIFIIYVDCVLQMSIYLIKENGFTLNNTRSRRYHVETMIGANYVDDLELSAKISTRVEFTLDRMKQAARGIGLNMNTDKTKFMYFKQE